METFRDFIYKLAIVAYLCIAFIGTANGDSNYYGTDTDWSMLDGSENGGPGLGNIPLFNIYNSGTNCNGSDDGRCNDTLWGFNFSRWGETFDGGRQNTNGCLNLISAAGGAPSDQCNDYTPQALPYRDYTIYPFWTDLIRGTAVLDSGVRETSKMAYQNFGDYVVYGWYFMREYNRDSSNSFELIIRNDNTFGMLYGELDVQNHDVLIGEQGKGSDGEHKTFAYYDDNTGGHTTFDSYDNANGNIEGATSNSSGPGWTSGKVVYSDTHDNQCDNDPLSSADCPGYDDAYAAQQLFLECSNDALYSSQCGNYEEAYTDSECDRDPLFSSTCPGYYAELQRIEDEQGTMWDDLNSMQGDEYGYSDEDRENQQGYTDGNDCGACGYDPRDDDSISYENLNGEQQMLVDSGMSLQDAVLITMGQDDLIRLGLDPDMQWNGTNQMGSHIEDEYTDLADMMIAGELDETWEEVEHEQNIEHFGDGYEDFTMEDWYEVDVREFGQEQVDEWMGSDIEFDDTGTIVWESYDYALDANMAEDLLYESHISNEELEYLIAMPGDTRDCPTCEHEEFLEEFEEERFEEEFLEDYEREALEEQEEEIYEEFIEEIGEERLEDLIDDEAFEELISEEELDELTEPEMEEEFFQEEREQVEVREEEQREEAREEQIERDAPARDTRSRRERSGGGSRKVSGSPMSLSIAVNKADFGGDSSTASVVQEIIQDSGSAGSTGGDSSNGGQQMQSSDGSSSNSGGYIAQESTTGDSTIQQQQEQSMGQSSVQAVTTIDSGVSTSAFEVAQEQTQTGGGQSQDFIQSFDDGQGISGSDQDFGTGLNDAIASGTGISDFLSQSTPDYGRFDIAPPTNQEQRVEGAVESLADQLGSEVASANLAEQLEAVQSGDEGEYGDQTIAVAYLGYTAGFSQYTGMTQIEDAPGYGAQSQIPDKKLNDNKMGFYMMAGNTQNKLQKMINAQYTKE